ncbi:HlyD family type I secretion periplasmic adaptor subunit [Sphingomonas sp. URHD0057]|uniref:HlyD family type I secretion periplasmic adaptor subunit n=1 Tax=Sphingomonas sp. URHD0057 TaxID=1380389 RepID=UPI000AAE465F|nr:HlyD family type I secretion periplasmic adaptor subunit [Sphingomonas sp. URHD0057]
MASIPFIGPAIRHRQPMTGARMVIVAAAAAFFLFLFWASLAQLDEVTRGQGKVIPSSKLQTITAAEPATVSLILVKSGQEVRKGELLARLDSPESRQVQAETESLQARVSRLTSEGTGQSVACTGTDCAGEAALRNARESAVRSKVLGLQASADQARRDAGEAAATIQSLQGSLALAQKQVSMLEPLAVKHIVPETDLLDKRREVNDIQGRIAAAREQQGRAMAAVREAQAQAAQAGFEFKQSALDERSQVAAKIAVNEETLRGARGRELRSPVDGVVNDVQVTTVGQYVQPGQKIMEVVPMGEKLLVETRVRPSDIAFIKVGDKALVKVTAYDFSIYGGLDGRVVQVSADSIYDENEKQAFFTVIVETTKSYLVASGHRLPITPGMMTDTQIITGRKSVLTYLLKPVLKARSEALHER